VEGARAREGEGEGGNLKAERLERDECREATRDAATDDGGYCGTDGNLCFPCVSPHASQYTLADPSTLGL
jgi:hypothetical protein